MVSVITGCAQSDQTPAQPISPNPDITTTTVPTPDSSSVESSARITAINTWAQFLNKNQDMAIYGHNAHLYTRLVNLSPDRAGELIAGGSEVNVSWEDATDGYGWEETKGDAELKNIQGNVMPYPVSPADQANGIEWKGNVNIQFIMRYRAVAQQSYKFQSNGQIQRLDVGTPPANEPYSPWTDSGVQLSVIKQNGVWTASIPLYTNGWHDVTTYEITDPEIFNPLPAVEYCWNFSPEQSQPWLIIK